MSVALMIVMMVGFSTMMAGCSSDRTTSVATNDDVTPAGAANAASLHDRYAWTGKYHNDALAYATAKIKESKQTSTFGRCKAGLAALKEFQKAFRKAGGNAAFDDLTLTDGMCEAAESPSHKVNATVGVDPNAVSANADISTAGNDLMNQILNQVDLATSVSGLASEVSGIEGEAGGSLDALEAAAVATTGSIAVSSAEYWVANPGTTIDDGPAPYARSANEVFGEFGDQSRASIFGLSDRAKKIIKADVSAAIGILLYNWWMGEAAVAQACIKAAAASLIAGLYFT